MEQAFDRPLSYDRQLLDRAAHAGDGDGGLLEVVEALAGLNAQTARGPSVGLWTRVAGFEQRSLDAELRAYRLVKANLLRGTVHLVTRRQYLAWRRALQPGLRRTVSGFCPGLWARADESAVLREGIAALRDTDVAVGLSRAELAERLGPLFPAADPRHLAFAVRLMAPVVQVADPSLWSPTRTRYVLADKAFGAAESEGLGQSEAFGDWLEPDGPVRTATSAAQADPAGLRDLLAAYLRSFGPATAADATSWSGVSRLAGPLAADFTRLPVPSGAGRPGRPGTPRTPPTFDLPEPPQVERPRPAYVLPEFDNLWFCRKRLPEPLAADKKRLLPNPVKLMLGALIVDGEVRADWRRDPGTGELAVHPWGSLDAEARAELDRFQTWYATTDADSRET